MATSPSSVFEVVSNSAGKARTGVCSLVDSNGDDIPAVGFSVAEFVADSGTANVAAVAAAVDALRDSLIAAGIMAAS